jgi:hypothetical protein
MKMAAQIVIGSVLISQTQCDGCDYFDENNNVNLV